MHVTVYLQMHVHVTVYLQMHVHVVWYNMPVHVEINSKLLIVLNENDHMIIPYHEYERLKR